MQSIIFKTNHVWGSNFFSNYLKPDEQFGNVEKNWSNIFWFGDNCIWIGCVKQSLLLKENTCHPVSICEQTVSRFQMLLKENFFQADFLSEWSKNMRRILPYRFNQCFVPFNMLTVHKCFDMGRFRHLSNLTFWSL